MRLFSIIEMGSDYLKLGIVGVLLLGFVLCIGYGLIYRKLLHGEKKLKRKSLLLGAICFCYLVVVAGATLMGRPGYGGEVCLYPFYSYRAAYNSQSSVEWRNLILNICLFVPWGFLLPLWGGRFRKFGWTVGSGVIGTLLIELVQFVAERGVVEFDDILNNTLGTLIGFGLSVVWLNLLELCKKKSNVPRKKRIVRIVLGLLPLVFVVSAFCVLGAVYAAQPYGNLASAPNRWINLKNATITAETEFKTEAFNVNIYKTVMADEEETKEFAEQLFALRNTSVDEERTDAYDDTIIYYSEDGKYSAWIHYAGLTYDMHAFMVYEDEPPQPKTSVDEETVRAALEKIDISVPKAAEFTEEENGYYLFSLPVDWSKKESKVSEGTISVLLYEGDIIGDVFYDVSAYTACGEEEILSEEEAYQKLIAGEFYYPYQQGEIDSLTVESVELSYELDSKGFYQPVYEFGCVLNGKDEITYLSISAMK